MKFLARCAAVVSKNGAAYVLLKFVPKGGHLIGEIARDLGELDHGSTYEVTITRVSKGE